ncbi:MAG TPA: hypothetical protein PK880_04760 [Candidatus Competibacter sp.]|nr:hypothetical protein [Candidatus Competibacteraceae bacterium]HRC71826.1 hypothetical protein [Candidatus Competibacter sp.]
MTVTLMVFLVVYPGMILGGPPFLQIGRTGRVAGDHRAGGQHRQSDRGRCGGAARRGIRIDWRTRGRAGVPVTLATLALSAGCFGWRLGGV